MKAEASGPTVSVTVNGAGHISAEGRVAGASATVQTATGIGIKSEVKVGVVEVKEGRVEAAPVKVEASTGVSAESEGNASQQSKSANTSVSPDQITVGGAIGLVGAAVTFVPSKIFAAASWLGNAISDFFSNVSEDIRDKVHGGDHGVPSGNK